MKKFLLFTFSILCMVALAFTCGCSIAKPADEISLKEGTEFEIALGSFDYSEYTLLVKRGNDTTEVPLDESMIATVDKLKVYQVGEHEITVNYLGASCSYTVKVLPNAFDEDIYLTDIDEVYNPDKTFFAEVVGELPQGTQVIYPRGNSFKEVCTDIEISAVLICESYATKTLKATVNIGFATYDMSGVKFDDAEYTYDGNSKSIAITGTLPKGVTVSYKMNGQDFTPQTLANPSGYNVTAVFTGSDRNYNPIGSMEAKLVIKKADYNLSSIKLEDKSVTYTGEAHTVSFDKESKLPKGVVFNDIYAEYYDASGTVKTTIESKTVAENNIVKKRVTLVNSYEYTVYYTFTVGDTANYNVPAPLSSKFTIKKATYDMSGVNFDSEYFVYNNEPQSLSITGKLPDGVSVSYEGNGGIDAGEHRVTANFAVEDELNYEIPESKHAVYVILRGTLKLSPSDFEFDEVMRYNGKKQVPVFTVKLLEGVEVSVDVYDEDGKPSDSIEIGHYSAVISVSGDSLSNYFPVEPFTLNYEIGKAVYDLSQLELVTEFTYDGQPHTPVCKVLPVGLDGSSPLISYGGSVTNVSEGSVNIPVYLTSDSEYYESSDTTYVAVTILPAEYTGSFTVSASDKTVAYDGKQKSIDVECSAGFTPHYTTVFGEKTYPDTNGATDVGEYTVKITFTCDDTNYYCSSNTALDRTLKITPAQVDISRINVAEAFPKIVASATGKELSIGLTTAFDFSVLTEYPYLKFAGYSVDGGELLSYARIRTPGVGVIVAMFEDTGNYVFTDGEGSSVPFGLGTTYDVTLINQNGFVPQFTLAETDFRTTVTVSNNSYSMKQISGVPQYATWMAGESDLVTVSNLSALPEDFDKVEIYAEDIPSNKKRTLVATLTAERDSVTLKCFDLPIDDYQLIAIAHLKEELNQLASYYNLAQTAQCYVSVADKLYVRDALLSKLVVYKDPGVTVTYGKLTPGAFYDHVTTSIFSGDDAIASLLGRCRLYYFAPQDIPSFLDLQFYATATGVPDTIAHTVPLQISYSFTIKDSTRYAFHSDATRSRTLNVTGTYSYIYY